MTPPDGPSAGADVAFGVDIGGTKVLGVALGTVADVVPLIGLNRAFVAKGLIALRRRELTPAAVRRLAIMSLAGGGTIGFRVRTEGLAC